MHPLNVDFPSENAKRFGNRLAVPVLNFCFFSHLFDFLLVFVHGLLELLIHLLSYLCEFVVLLIRTEADQRPLRPMRAHNVHDIPSRYDPYVTLLL